METLADLLVRAGGGPVQAAEERRRLLDATADLVTLGERVRTTRSSY